ncbi:TonB-dependent receptor plug domain-containing protein [Pelagicoccus sp. NFK12]|uniref:TonB-dependent receptor plug domain-containing protein n=1 Tax=Pelagicoccus enzymogenes TaxID=2773457 RepID=A0A927FBI3_9BACT|nr:TonB-dependent receptor plug domain-containing protein [Pelagicoccus enzymogenes]MBD5782057.1 TonB-dependent receptor plug domain-containing protein [Pelagicoccus enzymogenes]
MKKTKSGVRKIFAVVGGLIVGANSPLSGQAGESSLDGDEVFELSPFEVGAQEEQGYRATSSLVGGRTKMSMDDIANSVDVITKDLMEDMAVTDIQDIAVIANNVEPATVGFANTSGESREVWNYNWITIRGFRVGTATRNFMNLETSVDAYNTQSVDFSKGPNAVLFGLGDPGGTYNYSTKTPFFEDDNSVSYKIGSEGGHRFSFDVNRVLVEDKLSVRVNGLKQDWEYYHKPGYTQTDALHVSLRWKPLENSTFTFSHEYNNVDRAYPKMYFGQDRVTPWLAAGGPEVVDFALDVDDPRNPDGIAKGSNVLLAGNDKATPVGDAAMSIKGVTYMVHDLEDVVHDRFLQIDPYVVNGLQVADPYTYANFGYPMNYSASGPNGLSDTRYNVTELNFQQKLAENLYLDLSYGKNDQQKLSANGINSDIWVYPEAGERFGELYTVTSRPMQMRRYWDIEDIRMSLSYDFDFGDRSNYLGSHRIAVMAEKNDKTEIWEQGRLVTTRDPNNEISGSLRASKLRPSFYSFFNPAEGEYTAMDWRQTYWDQDRIEIDGYAFDWLQTDLWANMALRQKLDTKLYVLQSRFWNDRIVTSIGYRKEARDEFRSAGTYADQTDPTAIIVPEYGYVDNKPAGESSFRYAKIPGEPTDYVSGISRNHGLVFHATDWVSLTYNRSNSIGLPSDSKDIFGNFLGSSQGITDDYGVRFKLLEEKVFLSLNAYETHSDESMQFGDFRTDAWTLEEILVANSDVTGVTSNMLENGNGHTNASKVAEGIELMINGNFANGWSFRISGSQNETLINEAGMDMIAFWDERYANVYSNPAYQGLYINDGSSTFGARVDDAAYEIAKIRALQDNQQFPSSKYALTSIVKYKVQGDGFLGGSSFGTVIDWKSAPIVGYYQDASGNFDITRPAKGEERTNVDFFAAYGRSLTDKVDWRLQLNVRNVFDDNDPYVIEKRSVGTDPDNFTWQNYKWRPVNGLTWELTNSFSF